MNYAHQYPPQQQEQQQAVEEQHQQQQQSPPFETVPNVRWTFSMCPNNSSATSQGGSSSSSSSGPSGNDDSATNRTSNAAVSGVAAGVAGAVRAVTGGGASAGTGDSSVPPPFPDTVVPLACMYTPMFDHVTSTTDEGGAVGYMPRIAGALGRTPPQCKTCRTYLNKHITVDFATRVWACPCCFTRNTLPQALLDQAAAAVAAAGGGDPGEYLQQQHPIFTCPTIEYVLTGEQAMTPVFLFIVDICVDGDELEACKAQLIRSLEWLPQDARVGFMTFGQGITLWELGCNDMNRCYTFRGNRRYTREDLTHMLGLPRSAQHHGTFGAGGGGGGGNGGNGGAEQRNKSPPPPHAATSSSSSSSSCSFPGGVQDRFLCNLSDCDFALHSIIEDMKCDSFPVPVGHRPLRATGAALEIAVTLLELVADSHFGKVLLFVGGPCTRGPGAVADHERKVLLRSHKDLQGGDAPLYEGAVAFYKELEVRLTKTTSSLDCFVESLDQVGILELRSCVNNTGGLFVMGDKYQNVMFGTSLQRYFERSAFARDDESAAQLEAATGEHMMWTRGNCSGFGLDIRVNTSPETKIMGALGHVRAADSAIVRQQQPSQSQQQSSSSAINNISPHHVGVGGTNRWLTSCADSSLTLCFVFDTDCSLTSSSGRKRFVQIVTRYYATNGELRARVTSMAMPIIQPSTDPRQHAAIIQQNNAFDQECAAVVIARMTVSLMERSDNSRFETIRRWLDRLLVKFCRKFGSYAAGAPDSLRIPGGFSLFPAFMFNFRRSEYFMVLNISPDETTFKRHYLMREPCDNCTIMVQPVLYSYSMEEPWATAVPLDVDSIRADNILLIDAFFNVHIMYGVTIEEWHNAGYQEQEDFAHFKELLSLPQRDANSILETRMPYPWFSVTGRFGGDARHFINRFSAGGKASSSSSSAAAQQRSADGATLFTEDASMQKFMSSLKMAVVMSESK